MDKQKVGVARERLSQKVVNTVEKTSQELFEKAPDELSPRETGRLGEELALGCLKMGGLDFVERNYSCAFGEADLVMRDGDTAVLCEVKTRSEGACGKATPPELAVTPHKRQRYGKIARYYYSMHPWVESVRFDVLAVEIKSSRRARCTHFPNVYMDQP